MKTIFTFLLSTVFSLGTFANPTGTTQNNVPPEVKALVAELRENLNPGELLQHSREEAIGFIRNARQFAIIPLFAADKYPMYRLTDDEIFDYAALWSDFYLVCSAYLHSRYLLDEYLLPTSLPTGCEDYGHFSGKHLNVFADIINYYKADYPSIQTMARNLIQSRYWESAIYKKNGDIILSRFEETAETLIKVEQLFSPDQMHSWNYALSNVPSLQNADVYYFGLLDSRGYIAFKNGQAKLLTLLPVLYGVITN